MVSLKPQISSYFREIKKIDVKYAKKQVFGKVQLVVVFFNLTTALLQRLFSSKRGHGRSHERELATLMYAISGSLHSDSIQGHSGEILLIGCARMGLLLT